MSEYTEQCAVFRWADIESRIYPELALINSSQNGSRRSAHYGARLKAAGLRAGFPDIFLPVPRGGYHGLFIELKAGRNKPTEKQEWWLQSLANQGYRAMVCWGSAAAIEFIKEYLDEGRQS